MVSKRKLGSILVSILAVLFLFLGLIITIYYGTLIVQKRDYGFGSMVLGMGILLIILGIILIFVVIQILKNNNNMK